MESVNGFKIVDNEYLEWSDDFDSGHFLFFDYPSKCRRPHGHSFEIKVKIWGVPNENGVIFDFNHLKEIVKELDHKMFIPERAVVKREDGFVEVVTQNGGYLKLPENEVIIVPYKNVTSEFLSRFVLRLIAEKAGYNVNHIEVCIKEDKRSMVCAEAYRG